MSGWLAFSSDEELAQELRDLRRRSEPAPKAVVDAAKDAFKWKDIVAAIAIAQLEFDSVVDEDRLERVRDMPGERRLRFAGAGRSVEVAVVDNNGGLAGRVDPPLAGSMVLRHADGSTVTAPLDEHGLFHFGSFKRGPVSLRPLPSDQEVEMFQTDWMTL